MSLDAQADVPDLCKIKTQIQTFKHPSLIAADQCWVSGFCTLCARTQTASNTHRQQAGSHKSRATDTARPRSVRKLQAAHDLQGGGTLVHGVEMDGGHTPIDELLAQVRHHVQTECLDGIDVIAIALQAQADLARNFGTTGVRKTQQL